MELIGRGEQVAHLRSVLKWENRANGSLTILGINGPGGVGKTSLISMAEDPSLYKGLCVLRICIDATDAISSLTDFIEQIVHTIKQEAVRRYARPNIVLPETEATLVAFEEVLEAGVKEVKGGDNFIKTVKQLLSLGKAISKLSSTSRNLFDVEELENFIDADGGELIVAFKEEAPNLLNKLGFGAKSKNLRNAIRKNAANAFAVALEQDLRTILAGYDLKDASKALPEKIKGCDRLLLLIDDYEKVSESIGTFLAQHFLPLLKDTSFESVIVLSGRDDLTATHPSWNQHLQIHLVEPPIDVGPLEKEDIDAIAAVEKVDSEALWRDTDGYPYFIQLWIEAHRRGGETAISLKKFYDRTTRWMEIEQKQWLEFCVFINEVNLETLEKITTDRSLSEQIMNWFQSEASVRDTNTRKYTVRSYVRQRIKDYMELTDPAQYRKLSLQAKELDLE